MRQRKCSRAAWTQLQPTVWWQRGSLFSGVWLLLLLFLYCAFKAIIRINVSNLMQSLTQDAHSENFNEYFGASCCLFFPAFRSARLFSLSSSFLHYFSPSFWSVTLLLLPSPCLCFSNLFVNLLRTPLLGADGVSAGMCCKYTYVFDFIAY